MAVIVALLIALPAWAAPQDAVGGWAVRSNGQGLMIVTLAHDRNGWRGAWRRPKHFDASGDFRTITAATSTVVDRLLVTAVPANDALQVSFRGAAAGDKPDTMIFRVLDDGTARMNWLDSPDGMLVLDRAGPAERPIACDPQANYPIDQHWRTNAEMTAIFDSDQSDRQSPVIEWSAVGSRDLARKGRTKALLDAGLLASGDDYYHAAFVFQHGSEPNDYLLAHTLAMIAVARGRPDANWIAAATLDRYLQRIGQKQIFGTQFTYSNTSATTQDP
ncbi:MAG TPA: hypothetical protein VF409_02455 [Sphingomonas sp.]